MREVIPSEKVALAIHGYDALPLTQVKYKNADSNVTYTHNQPTNRILSAPKWATPHCELPERFDHEFCLWRN